MDASPSGTVADGTVERLTQRWHERVSGEAAAATAASNAVLAKFAADAAAQRCVLRRAPLYRADLALFRRAADAEFAASRQARQAEVRLALPLFVSIRGSHRLHLQEAENKRAVIAQLDAAASSEDEDDVEDEDDDDLGGGAPSRPAATAELERARQEAQRAAADRRAAIKLAVEREDRKKAEHEARRLIREQAGHTNSKASAKGRGAGDAKGDAKRK